MNNDVGVLLTNIGTPAAPTPAAVKQYLKVFLSDPRVVEIPAIVWLPILHGFILPVRSKKSARLYQKIWTPAGSPLQVISQRIATQLQASLNMPVVLGMHYSEPSIPHALAQLKDCKKIQVLPLYPQYSSAATGAAFDLVMNTLKTWRKLPEIQFINDYADHPLYIDAIAKSILQNPPKQHLLFSFHGIPMRAINQGDPYEQRCRLTAHLVAKQLNLSADQWSIAFQSRLGKAKWLEPYTDHVLKQLPKKGVTELSVIAPGFAADCLETLEEIAIRGREQFLSAGGNIFNYINALNDSEPQIKMLCQILNHYKASP